MMFYVYSDACRGQGGESGAAHAAEPNLRQEAVVALGTGGATVEESVTLGACHNGNARCSENITFL